LGQILGTPNALNSLPQDQVLVALQRHSRGDWGDVCDEDWHANESALVNGSRLFSVYHHAQDTKFWIITEADRSATTVLLPDDY
jgi:hypothetical protein